MPLTEVANEPRGLPQPIQPGTLNARFSWEFAPLSFVYVVYNDRQAIRGGKQIGRDR